MTGIYFERNLNSGLGKESFEYCLVIALWLFKKYSENLRLVFLDYCNSETRNNQTYNQTRMQRYK